MNRTGKITTHTHMQQRIDTAENWSTDNPVLYEGEIGYESQPETGGKLLPPKIKIGDGKTAWNDLPYQEGGEGSFKAYITPTVTIDAGEEHTFLYPPSDKILTQVHEISDGGAHDDKSIAFDSVDKYTHSDDDSVSIGDGRLELCGGVDSYTKLLLHFNGTNGSTEITDSSSSQAKIANNGVTLNTGKYKFGTSSASFNGSSTYFSVPYSSEIDLSTNDFTVDFWYAKGEAKNTHGQAILSQCDTQGVLEHCPISISFGCSNASDIPCVYIGATAGVIGLIAKTSITDTNWHHYAVTRASNTVSFFIDGNLVDSKPLTSNLFGVSYPLVVGRFGQFTGYNSILNGFLDELRISNGVARWTSNFIPPNGEYHKAMAHIASNVATTNLSNYSLSQVTKINSLTIPVIAPDSTSVKILTSFDGRKTWLYHDNSGWHSFGTIGEEWTVCNSSTELQDYFTNLTMKQLTTDLGYLPTSIDFMFQLETADDEKTPVVSALTMNCNTIGGFQYADVGSYGDTTSRYGLKIDGDSQLSVKNKDTASHNINLYIVPLKNVTYLS